MSNHLEPYDGKAVAKWLERRGARQLVTVGGGLPQFEVAPGRIVKVGHDYIPTVHAKVIAAACGMSYGEFRAAMGHPIVKVNRARKAPRRIKFPTCSKAELKARTGALRLLAAEVDRQVAPGLRDGAHYLRVLQHLADAERALRRAVDETKRVGE